jgi:hypothetical protein
LYNFNTPISFLKIIDPSMTEKRSSSVLIRTVVVLLLTMVVVELAARTAWAQKAIPYRSFGIFHYQFEIKWFRLQEFARQNGGVDVIVLGSSLVNTGVDPDVMAQAYYEQTGKHLRIFNFGVEGLTIDPNSIVAKMLVDKYHPALLIYVTEMRDFIAGLGLDYQERFLSDPWMEYQQGKINLLGWLLDHSMALQTYLPYRNWMRADFPETIHLYRYRSLNTSTSGYEAENEVGEAIDIPPDPNNPAELKNFETFGNFVTAPSRLQNLESMLALGKNEGTKVLIVEMPVHPTFYIYVGGEAVHKQFQETISSAVTKAGGSFIPAEACGDIPLNGRANRWHLNKMGAPVFSTCLAKELVALCAKQKTDFISTAPVNQSH